MTISLNIEADTFEDLRARACVALGLNILDQATPPQVQHVPDEPKKRTTAAPKEPIGTELGAEDVAVRPNKDESEKPSGEQTYDYATDIKPAVLKVSQKHGRQGVQDLLKPYDVDNAQKIPASAYPELMATIAALLED